MNRSFGGVRHSRIEGTSGLAKAGAEEALDGLKAALSFPIRDIGRAGRCYSSRNTLIGSSLDALQAGRNPAIVATPRSTSAMATKAPN